MCTQSILYVVVDCINDEVESHLKLILIIFNWRAFLLKSQILLESRTFVRWMSRTRQYTSSKITYSATDSIIASVVPFFKGADKNSRYFLSFDSFEFATFVNLFHFIYSIFGHSISHKAIYCHSIVIMLIHFFSLQVQSTLLLLLMLRENSMVTWATVVICNKEWNNTKQKTPQNTARYENLLR